MARTFNGTTDTINQLVAPITGFPFTFSAWFKKTSFPVNWSVILELDTNGANQALTTMYMNSAANLLLLSVDAGGVAAQAIKGSYTTGTWFHAGGRFLNSANRIPYLNANPGPGDFANIPFSSYTRLVINRIASGNDNTSGSICEIGIWDATLSDEEFTILAKGLCPRLIRPHNLKAYVPLIREIQNINSNVTMNITGTTVSDHPRIFY